MMQPNYDAMTQAEETSILWALIKNQDFDILSNPQVHAELKEELNNDVLEAYEADNGDDYSQLTDELFLSLLNDKVGELGKSALSIGNVYSELREQFNNLILDKWVKENPNQAYPIDCKEVQSDPAARSISDDDLCAFCALCAYCPGEQSVCRLVAKENNTEWPAEFNEDGYAEQCERFQGIKRTQQNWA